MCSVVSCCAYVCFKLTILLLNQCDLHSLRYDTIGEFNVDSKAECCDHLNLAHETKTKNVSAH